MSHTTQFTFSEFKSTFEKGPLLLPESRPTGEHIPPPAEGEGSSKRRPKHTRAA